MDLVRERVIYNTFTNSSLLFTSLNTLRELTYQCMNCTYVQLSKNKTNATNPSPFSSKLKCGKR